MGVLFVPTPPQERGDQCAGGSRGGGGPKSNEFWVQHVKRNDGTSDGSIAWVGGVPTAARSKGHNHVMTEVTSGTDVNLGFEDQDVNRMLDRTEQSNCSEGKSGCHSLQAVFVELATILNK